jgi:hypothetical protein
MSNLQRGSDFAPLTLHTSDALYDDDYNYMFPLSEGLQRVKNIQLLSYNMTWSFPNIRTMTNTIVWSEQGSATKFTAQLDVGNYSDEDVVIDLVAKMNATAGLTQTYTISENFNTQKFSLTGSLKEFTVYYPDTTLCDLIGLTETSTSTNKTLTFGNKFNLQPSSEIQIRLPNLIHTYGSGKNKFQDLIQIVSLSGYTYGDLIKENNSSVVCATLVDKIPSVTMSITDNTGYSLDWDPNIDMSFVFQIEYW